ncbi:MAG: hypothetical protein P4L46_06715 [Fimbriimonas sp.]|nr:hypothetical protein [Fimbriimonas sp.]
MNQAQFRSSKVALAAAFCLCGFGEGARADVKYTVDVRPDTKVLHVMIRLEGTNHGSRFQIPNWGPGGYVLRDSFKNVKNLIAKDAHGHALAIETKMETLHKKYQEGQSAKIADNDVCTWIVAPAKETILEYDIPLGARELSDGSVHWSGPSTYLYEINHRRDKCLLAIDVPANWPVCVGLTETKPGSNAYVAKTYDVLADNPVSTGNLLVDHYECRGKMHWIVLRGAAKAKVDRNKLIQACRFVSECETDFFGDSAPYDKYVWHFAVNDTPDGAGGLEHLSSTEISLAAGVGPRAKSVLAHEFFHLWNVKRIRSRVLGPFDYTKLPETGALWWLEGVTDYYAYTLPHRYDGIDDKAYFAAIAANLQAVRNNPDYKMVGPFESSMRVDESNHGRGNSNGYLISYYNLGWLAGMVLDIELRSHTNGKHSLDDVEHALWDLCKNDKPGFDEGEIRKQLVRFGGLDMGNVYDRVVMKADGMAIEDTLSKVGLELTTTPGPYVDLGFNFGGFPGSSVLNVVAVRSSVEGKLQVGDQIVAVDGEALVNADRGLAAEMARRTRGIAAGKALKLTIKRAGESIDVDVTPVSATRDIFSVDWAKNPTPSEKRLGAEWLASKKYRP